MSQRIPVVDELTRLVCELVAIESVNPDLGGEGSGESEIAGFVSEWLRGNGLEVDIVEPVAGRPSVVGLLRGSGGGRSLMLNAHMDTVAAGGMTNAFSPRVESGRVYGRGAYDMKGSLAAIMVAAREVRKLGLRGDLILTAVADEEVASRGTQAVLEGITADTAIVTEPTELQLCIAHKGFVWLEIESRGVAAHGSRADLGLDAVARMGRILTGVVDLDRRLRSGRGHPLLGTGSIHASQIEGGRELSTYPARCVVKLERRTLPGEDAASALRELEAVISRARRADPRLDASARVLLDRMPTDVKPDSELAVAVATAAYEARGIRPGVVGVAYWMDMALLNAAGMPAVAFGPSGAGEHADVEWVDVASLETCVRTYLKVAASICGTRA